MRKKYPTWKGEKPLWRDYAGSINQFSDALSPYLSSLPKDPDSKRKLDLHWSCGERYPNYASDPWCRKLDLWRKSRKYLPLEEVIEEGEYFLQQRTTTPGKRGHAMLFTSVETPEAANRVN